MHRAAPASPPTLEVLGLKNRPPLAMHMRSNFRLRTQGRERGCGARFPRPVVGALLRRRLT
eukprot:6115037-Pyramimonas_sp.AAC.1